VRNWKHWVTPTVMLFVSAGVASASELAGSPASMRRQHAVARENDFSFLRTPAAVRALAEKGKLVEVRENADLVLAKVSQPYARPEIRLFIERLARQYRDATGHKLVVTSLTRPTSAQPGNAHRLSVHPAGMAVDLRVPASSRERSWLERTLLQLEDSGVLDVTRERNPPHYHVAIFPDRYREYVAVIDSAKAAAAARVRDSLAKVQPSPIVVAPTVEPRPTQLPVKAGIAGVMLFAVGVVLKRKRQKKLSADSPEGARLKALG
jgi:hypothetical protein